MARAPVTPSRRTSYRRPAAFLLYMVLLSLLAFAQEESWQWPVEEPEAVENYAGNRRFPAGEPGTPPLIHGMRLESPQAAVRAVGAGRTVYLAEGGGGTINGFASPLGGIVALTHPGGLRSIYGHIDPVSPYGDGSSLPLGRLDGSGAQLGRTLFLSLYDERLRRSLNPRLLLPELSDRFRPVVQELRLYAVDDRRLLWSSTAAQGLVLEGTVRVAALVYDRQSLTDRIAPYRVTMFANGAQIGDFRWDTRDSWELHRTPQGSRRYLEVEAANVTLVDGANTVEVVVTDFRGNQEERIFTLRRARR